MGSRRKRWLRCTWCVLLLAFSFQFPDKRSENDPTKAPPIDPLAALEKTVEAATHTKTVLAPRLEQLQDHADRMRADPYAHSLRVRKQFRAEKKVDAARKRADDAVRAKFALSDDIALEADNDALREEALRELEQERERRRAEPPALGVGVRKSASMSASSGAAGLKAALLRNTYSKLPSKSKPPLAGSSSKSSSLVIRRP